MVGERTDVLNGIVGALDDPHSDLSSETEQVLRDALVGWLEWERRRRESE